MIAANLMKSKVRSEIKIELSSTFSNVRHRPNLEMKVLLKRVSEKKFKGGDASKRGATSQVHSRRRHDQLNEESCFHTLSEIQLRK